MKSAKAVVVIPARYASTRLHGKLILPEVKAVTGRYIIEHVYQNVRQAKRIHKVIVATDNQLIYDIVKGFGGEAEMTSLSHTSGTDRIAEVAGHLDPHVVKVVLDNRGYALYFSRSQIPYVRDGKDPIKVPGVTFLKHLGIYAYRREFLLRYSKLPDSVLESAEKLEQLRALSNGYKIKVAITNYASRGIDTREDLTAFMERYKHD